MLLAPFRTRDVGTAMRGLRIQRAGRSPAVEVMLDSLDNLPEEMMVRLTGHIAHARGKHDILQRKEGMVGRQGFGVEDVQGRAGDPALAQCRDQCRCDDTAP